MALLSDPDRQKVAELFASMAEPVRLVFFTQSVGCESCTLARQILDELVTLSDKLTLEEVNFVLDKDKVAELGVDRVPAIAVVGATDRGIRFYGAPSGYEFTSLLDAIMLASGAEQGLGADGLSPESLALVAAVDEPVEIQIFTTPT
jgi:alkyl hydroperoxide reductase subunit AhpF